MRFKAVALTVTCALVVSASYVIRAATQPSRPAAAAIDGLSQAPGTFDPAELARLIRAYEERLHARPDALDYGFLARLYLERARLTSDVASYGRADAAVTAARNLAPDDVETRALLASVRYGLHDFRGALSLAREALAENPEDPAATSLLGDALLELGEYEGAVDAYGRLAALAPGAAGVEARLARLAFLRGDSAGAARIAEAAQRAAASEGAFGPGLAWHLSLRSQIAFDSGAYDRAAMFAEGALRASPLSHGALGALARARAAQGRHAEAIGLLERAVEQVPQPELLGLLGDLLILRGDPAAAEERYRTVEVIGDLVQANRQVYDRGVAFFLADHGRDPAEAVRLAAAELEIRKDVYGWDVYAWALHAAGRHAEARIASDRALALGTWDARLWYHAGMISTALGDPARGRAELERALAIGPQFDPLQAPRARDALAALSSHGAAR